jgi:hypothetical protein
LIILLASTLKARIAKRRGETHLRTGARHQ